MQIAWVVAPFVEYVKLTVIVATAKMASEGPSGIYRISKLKGAENYDSWKEEIQGILTLNKLWLVVIGKETSPTEPESTSTESSSSKEQETYTEKLLAWEDKNARAVAIIRLSCESGPRVHIKGMEDGVAVWIMLKKQYEVSDMTTLDLAIHSICQSVQSDFKTLDEYGQNVKENAAKCSAMGYDIPDWLLSSMFRMGLHTELKPYIFHLAQGACTAKKTLTVDEMVTTDFADHDKRHQHREDNETKTLRARSFYKSKNSCTHCDRTSHNKEEC